MEKSKTFNVGTSMTDLRGFMSPEQVELLYNSAKHSRDKILIRLLWKSGRRICEVLNVRIKDIDFDNRNILFLIEKKRVKNLMKWKPMDSQTLDLLKEYISTNSLTPENFLFESIQNTGKPISRQRAFQIVRALGKLANIETVGEKKIHPHHFRHSFAVNMAKKLKTPGDVRKLQMFLEHSDLGMTETYLQFSGEDVRELIES